MIKIELNNTYSLEKIFSEEVSFLDYKPDYCIYRIHNLLTNKSYIGDCRSNVKKRFISKGWSHKSNYENAELNHPLYNS